MSAAPCNPPATEAVAPTAHRTAAPLMRDGGSAPPGLMWTRAGIIALVAVVSWVTISYCSSVYFDRTSAFHNALECSVQVLGEHQKSNWLLNGTLLGSTRLGRLVLWDADLDFGVLLGSDNDFDATSAALDAQCFGYSATVKGGERNPALRVWRKCTSRICAEFFETRVEGSVMKTGYGESLSTELFPLKECTISSVAAMCPSNAHFYLEQAYGQDWLTIPLIKLF